MTPNHYNCQLTYELMSIEFTFRTVFTGKTFQACIEALKNYPDERLQKHFSIDVVVRDGDGRPMFRQSLFSLNSFDGNMLPNYVELHGRYGHCVYNDDYRYESWAGYENYSKPMEVIDYKWERYEQ